MILCPPVPLLASIGDHIRYKENRKTKKEVANVAFSAGGRGLRKIQIRQQQKTLACLGPLGVCRRMNLVFKKKLSDGIIRIFSFYFTFYLMYCKIKKKNFRHFLLQ
jgi:hypothetical protein